MQNSGFAVATTDCGVTPQAQNTGISSSLTGTASPQSGLPRGTGAPCTAGKRVVIWTARMALAGVIGRIDTTIGPWNGPAGVVAIEVRYIGTVALQVMWRSSMPPSTSASSNENEQPSTNATRSSRQWARMSAGSST